MPPDIRVLSRRSEGPSPGAQAPFGLPRTSFRPGRRWAGSHILPLTQTLLLGLVFLQESSTTSSESPWPAVTSPSAPTPMMTPLTTSSYATSASLRRTSSSRWALSPGGVDARRARSLRPEQPVERGRACPLLCCVLGGVQGGGRWLGLMHWSGQSVHIPALGISLLTSIVSRYP